MNDLIYTGELKNPSPEQVAEAERVLRENIGEPGAVPHVHDEYVWSGTLEELDAILNRTA